MLKEELPGLNMSPGHSPTIAARSLGQASKSMSNKSRAQQYEARLAIQPTAPVYNDDDVDLLQIREFLDMTPVKLPGHAC